MFTRVSLTTFIFLLAFVVVTKAQTPSDLHVKLSLAENKTVYRIGEPIKLVLEFTSDREGYTVEILPEGNEPWSDTILISPDSGFAKWVAEMNDNLVFPRDVVSFAAVTTAPQRVPLIVNDSIRFDNPGKYSISVKTRRVTQTPRRAPLVLMSNPINIEVQAMSDEDEAKEVKRISELLNARHDFRGETEAATQLAYLAGDVSTREKVKRAVLPEGRSGNYQSEIWTGLFIARNRALVVKLLEAALRDPNVPATTQLLFTLTRLKKMLTDGVREPRTPSATYMLSPNEDPRVVEIRDGYVIELAAGLAKRTGNSQDTTALTILSALPKDAQASSAALREVRPILLQHFDSMDPFDRDSLLRNHWEQLRDPSLIPLLKKMMTPSDNQSRGLRPSVLSRLMELAPDEARPYVIAEIRDPGSFMDAELLGKLSDESLPDLDGPLLDQIRSLSQLTNNGDFVRLKLKTALLVRFATANIYQQVLDLYRTAGAKLPPDSRAGLLAYLAKQNEREAIPLVEEAVRDLGSAQASMMLTELTRLYYSESVGELLKKYLETDDLDLASCAAYLLGLHGAAADEAVLEERLKHWREQWRDRVADADAQQQGRIERELVYALIHGQAWKVSDERTKELSLSCVTQLCKQSNRAPRP